MPPKDAIPRYEECLFKYRNQFDRLVIRDGLLCRRKRHPSGTTIHQLIIPHALIPKVLSIIHSSPSAPHFGASKTIEIFEELCYWHGMRKDVAELCSHCESCCSYRTSVFPPSSLPQACAVIAHPSSPSPPPSPVSCTSPDPDTIPCDPANALHHDIDTETISSLSSTLPPSPPFRPPPTCPSYTYVNGELYGVNLAHTLALRQVAERLAALDSCEYTGHMEGDYSTSCSPSTTSPCASPEYQSSGHFDFSSSQPSAFAPYPKSYPSPKTHSITCIPARSSQLSLTSISPSNDAHARNHDPMISAPPGQTVTLSDISSLASALSHQT